ncbi:MAG: Co2+/Mg2+ efflux protein ApaG [Bacteroidota bacterium]
MNTLISKGVEISVEVFYQPEYSQPVMHEFMFAYRINIINHNSFTVQLLRREWSIFDSTGEHRQVEGDGVVGQQPVLSSGENFQYVSGCNLKTEMGKMWGIYEMLDTHSQQKFMVDIPAFQMIAPLKNN